MLKLLIVFLLITGCSVNPDNPDNPDNLDNNEGTPNPEWAIDQILLGLKDGARFHTEFLECTAWKSHKITMIEPKDFYYEFTIEYGLASTIDIEPELDGSVNIQEWRTPAEESNLYENKNPTTKNDYQFVIFYKKKDLFTKKDALRVIAFKDIEQYNKMKDTISNIEI
ncbi:MAG: hypothetical protein ACRC0X_01635 [Brevinema sp.]